MKEMMIRNGLPTSFEPFFLFSEAAQRTDVTVYLNIEGNLSTPPYPTPNIYYHYSLATGEVR